MDMDIISTIEQLHDVVNSVIDIVNANKDNNDIKESLHYAMTLIEAVRKYLVTENSNVLTDVKLKSDEVKVALKYKEEDENVKDNKHSDDEICEDFVKEEIPVKLNISKQSNIRKIQERQSRKL